MNDAPGPLSAVAIRRAQNERKAIELGQEGLDPKSIAKQIRMPFFVVVRILTVAGIPLLPPPPAVIPAVQPPASQELPSLAPHRRGRPPDVRVHALSPSLPRRGPGRPRKVPRDPNPNLPAAHGISLDPEMKLVQDRFSDFRTLAAISTALKVPMTNVRAALTLLSPERLAAWKELNRLRREVERMVFKSR